MEREGNRIWTTPSKLISMNAPKDNNGNYVDNIASTFNEVFSQYELDSLDRELLNLYSIGPKNYIMLYGLPLNIKLFIFHRMVHLFIGMVD